MATINFLNSINQTIANAIRARTYTADVSGLIQSFADAGNDIIFDAGKYPIKNSIRQRTVGARWLGGADRSNVTFEIRPDFAGTEYVIRMIHYGVLRDITLDFYQQGGMQLAEGAAQPAVAVTQYPWAIDLSTDATRCRIDNVTLNRAWNGINGNGNCGGLNMGRIEDGSLNVGLFLNGPLDFVTIESWESWVYGFSGTPLMDWSYANPGNLQLLRSDGTSVNSMNLWHKRLIHSNASELATSIGVLKLDGGDAHLRNDAGRLVIGALNALTDSLGSPVVWNIGGKTVIAALQVKHATAAYYADAIRLVRCDGGQLIINGGFITGESDGPSVELLGGTLSINNVSFDGPGLVKANGAPRTLPQGEVKVTGGRLKLNNCYIQDAGSNGPLGYFVYIQPGAADWHAITNNFFGSRKFSRPNYPGNYTGNVAFAGAEEVF